MKSTTIVLRLKDVEDLLEEVLTFEIRAQLLNARAYLSQDWVRAQAEEEEVP